MRKHDACEPFRTFRPFFFLISNGLRSFGAPICFLPVHIVVRHCTQKVFVLVHNQRVGRKIQNVDYYVWLVYALVRCSKRRRWMANIPEVSNKQKCSFLSLSPTLYLLFHLLPSYASFDFAQIPKLAFQISNERAYLSQKIQKI